MWMRLFCTGMVVTSISFLANGTLQLPLEEVTCQNISSSLKTYNEAARENEAEQVSAFSQISAITGDWYGALKQWENRTVLVQAGTFDQIGVLSEEVLELATGYKGNSEVLGEYLDNIMSILPKCVK